MVVVGGAGAGEVVAGDDDPLVAFVDEDVDHGDGECHFGGEESFGVVGEVHVAVPGFPPGLFEGLYFFAEDGFWEDGAEGVVVGEADEVEAWGAGGCGPAAGLAVAVPPSGAVAELVVGGELADVVDEGAGVAHGEAACGVDVLEGVAWAALVGGDAVCVAEDVDEVVFGVLGGAIGVGLVGFEDDGVPGVLGAVDLGAVGVPFWPVDGLVVVPEAGDPDGLGLGWKDGEGYDGCDEDMGKGGIGIHYSVRV